MLESTETEVFANMLSTILFTVALLFSFVYGSLATENRIYGGQEAKPGQFPHQSSLRFRGVHTCGGSILSDHFILTAAECIWERNESRYVIIVGAHKRKGNDGPVHQISRFIWHEDYNDTSKKHDIGLIEVYSSIKFDAHVAPISLHKKFIGAGIEAVTCGWGHSNVIFKHPLNASFNLIVAFGLNR